MTSQPNQTTIRQTEVLAYLRDRRTVDNIAATVARIVTGAEFPNDHQHLAELNREYDAIRRRQTILAINTANRELDALGSPETESL
jgi:hypothetical protein